MRSTTSLPFPYYVGGTFIIHNNRWIMAQRRSTVLPLTPRRDLVTKKPDAAQYEQHTDGDVVQGQNNLKTREENPMELEVTTIW